jgi:CHAD domain-containing protein
MAFKLEDKESFNDSFQRIVAEQIDKAISSLAADSEDLDKSVHDARVCLKKIRALLRLVRHSLGNEIFASQNKSFRNVGRLLAGARTPAAMIQIVDLIDEHADDAESKALLQTFRRLISESQISDEEQRVSAMSQAQAELQSLRQQISEWPEVSVDLSFQKGLRQVYKRGRTSFDEAYEAYTVDAFHEWRKHVKHLLYQSRILRPIWPRFMKALLADLKTTGQLLSEDHDLALFRKMILEDEFAEVRASKDIEPLVQLIDRRRIEVEDRARSLGKRLYTEKPRAFARRMHTYWNEWRED